MWFSSRPEVIAGIAPTGVACILSARSGAVTLGEVACPADGRDWRPALACLERVLTGSAVRGARLKVVLAHALSRFLTVPWSEDLMDAAGTQRFLHDQFDSVFGDSSREWTYAAEYLPYHQPRLACAVESGCLAELRRIAQALNLRLESVVPWAVVAVNRLRHELPDDGWLLAAEPECMAVLEVRNHCVAQVALQAWSGSVEEAADLCVRRARMRSGASAGLPVRIRDISSATEGWVAAMAKESI